MIRTKNGLKAIGLCVLALGLMAFSASAAQAEGTWDEDGTPITVPLPLVALKDSQHLVLLAQNLGVEILCTTPALQNASLNTTGGINAGASVRFTGCVTYEYGTSNELEACVPTNGGTEEGVIETVEGHALIALHEGEPITIVLPDEGGVFANIEYPNEECALPEVVPVGGTLTLLDCENAFTTSQPTHLVEEGVLSNLWIYNEEIKAEIHGSANVKLANGHSWNGLPK
jgi:hypothetical protein